VHVLPKVWVYVTWIGVFLTGAGCAPPAVTPLPGCDYASTPGFEVGTGERSFVEITDDVMVPYVAGFQGGYHVWGSARVTSTAATSGELAFNLCQDGRTIARSTLSVVLTPTEDETAWMYSGVTVIVLHDLQPDQIAGREATLAARYVDADGVVFTDTARFVPTCCTSIIDGP
jgi:hypothetical protein